MLLLPPAGERRGSPGRVREAAEGPPHASGLFECRLFASPCKEAPVSY